MVRLPNPVYMIRMSSALPLAACYLDRVLSAIRRHHVSIQPRQPDTGCQGVDLLPPPHLYPRRLNPTRYQTVEVSNAFPRRLLCHCLSGASLGLVLDQIVLTRITANLYRPVGGGFHRGQ